VTNQLAWITFAGERGDWGWRWQHLTLVWFDSWTMGASEAVMYLFHLFRQHALLALGQPVTGQIGPSTVNFAKEGALNPSYHKPTNAPSFYRGVLDLWPWWVVLVELKGPRQSNLRPSNTLFNHTQPPRPRLPRPPRRLPAQESRPECTNLHIIANFSMWQDVTKRAANRTNNSIYNQL